MLGRRPLLQCAAWAVTAVLALAACGGGASSGDGAGSITLVVSPEFVQGIIPGAPITVLVTAAAAGGGEVTISAQYSDGTVRVEPASIRPGQIAEVTITASGKESKTKLTITAAQGGDSQSATREVEMFPWDDDREGQARQLLDLFARWLADTVPRLGITPERPFDGVFVAPKLLVVSHYEFFDDEYELGLSWHIMLAPDDWAELYLRPRNQLHPARAFRLSSWSTALAGGPATFSEVPPPAEVVR